MKDKRFKWGIVATVAWVCIGLIFALVFERPNKLNEWGDAFAGFFAPVAFLWLVLGYLQQGEELRNSSRALELQVEELRSSVQQQAELVRVTAEQHNLQVQEMEAAGKRRAVQVRPKVQMTAMNTEPSGMHYRMTYVFENSGGSAFDIEVSIQPQSQRLIGELGTTQLLRGGRAGFQCDLHLGVETKIALSYVDELGERGWQEVTFTPDSGTIHQARMLRSI